MTGAQMHNNAAAYVGAAIDESDALVAINEAIDKLGDMGLVHGSANIVAGSATAWYPLPDDLTSLVSVDDGDGEDYRSFAQNGSHIRFAEPDTYTIYYRKHPTGVESLADTPCVHVSYHDVICTYLKAWAKMREDDKSQEGSRLMAQFERDAAKVFGILRRRRGPGVIRVERAAIPG
jgi:hypothetical protein